ncbi:MAG: uroporphyrinogen decarboxylase [Gammaproteobacteria bacterium]|nr:uroporphyrinogen decarboxylase [Gammaproteobacteria bacterium]
MGEEISSSRLIRALFCQSVDKTPVWIMRQAGRYLPEYRTLREKAGSFLMLCKTPDLASELTLQPIRRFDLDAAIIFSDILTIPDAMGLELCFEEGQGPYFKRPLKTLADIRALAPPHPETSLRYVCDAIKTVKRELGGTIPLIGFSGSPWTLACYMLEGKGSKTFTQIKRLMWEAPLEFELLITCLSQAVADYLNAQITAGVDVVMVFDTWGGILANSDYERATAEPLRQVLSKLKREELRRKIPNIIYAKGCGDHLAALAKMGWNAIGLDWMVDPSWARQIVGEKVALQGNLDPAVLYCKEACVKTEVQKVLDAFGPAPGYIFNLGHGIPPTVDPERVRFLVDAVHHFGVGENSGMGL